MKSSIQILGIDIHFEIPLNILLEENSITGIEERKHLIDLIQQRRSLETLVLIFPILSVATSNLVPHECWFCCQFTDWKISISYMYCATYGNSLAFLSPSYMGVYKRTLLPVIPPTRFLVGTESCTPIIDCISPELNIIKHTLCSLDSQHI